MPVLVLATPGAPDSTAYLDDAALLEYAEQHATLSTAAASAGPDVRARALVQATARLDTETFTGVRATTTQALAWPRVKAWDGDAGAYFGDGAIPARLVKACAELALIYLPTAAAVPNGPALDAPDPKRDWAKVGGELAVDFVPAPLRLDADSLERWPRVWRQLKPLLAEHAPEAPSVQETEAGYAGSRFAILRSQRDGNGCRNGYGFGGFGW